jgi:hypothetical protein
MESSREEVVVALGVEGYEHCFSVSGQDEFVVVGDNRSLKRLLAAQPFPV